MYIYHINLDLGKCIQIYIYIYVLWIQTPPEKVQDTPPNHTPNTS